MNTKTIIGALVGAILLFVWQFISWGAVNFHSGEQQYTVHQDSILSVLSEKLEEGTYFLPNVPPGTNKEGFEKYKLERGGKPWAVVSYHKSMETDMTMNMVRAFVSDLLAVLFLIWILTNARDLNFAKSILFALAIGMIGFLSVTYLNTIWFKNPAMDDLIDVFASWGIVGAWLGWWLPRKAKA
jgi:hypothetical protein